jgi:hypothetical protein
MYYELDPIFCKPCNTLTALANGFRSGHEKDSNHLLHFLQFNISFLTLLSFYFAILHFFSLEYFFCYVVMRQLVIVLKVVGCNSNTNKNNDFVLKERMKWYHKSRDLNERKKKDFYSVLKRWWIMKFTLPKIGVNTYISLKK